MATAGQPAEATLIAWGFDPIYFSGISGGVRMTMHDLAAFTAVGIAPERMEYQMLKSRIHWRAGLRSLAHVVVECAGTGVCTSDYTALGLHKVRRPIYPIDEI